MYGDRKLTEYWRVESLWLSEDMETYCAPGLGAALVVRGLLHSPVRRSLTDEQSELRFGADQAHRAQAGIGAQAWLLWSSFLPPLCYCGLWV